jgi:predicted HNH restriction endonuclease
MKQCQVCKQTKDNTDFYTVKATGKLRGWCKKCLLSYNSKHRAGKKYNYHLSAEQRRKYGDRDRFGGLRHIALERDGWICQLCGMTNEEHINKWKRQITVHHIDGNGRYTFYKNNLLENMVTLCLSCHGKEDIKFKGTKVSLKNKLLY